MRRSWPQPTALNDFRTGSRDPGGPQARVCGVDRACKPGRRGRGFGPLSRERPRFGEGQRPWHRKPAPAGARPTVRFAGVSSPSREKTALTTSERSKRPEAPTLPEPNLGARSAPQPRAQQTSGGTAATAGDFSRRPDAAKLLHSFPFLLKFPHPKRRNGDARHARFFR